MNLFVVYVPTEQDTTALVQGEETAIHGEEPELDSIEKIKVDLPKNIIKNMDDLTFVQPDFIGI